MSSLFVTLLTSLQQVRSKWATRDDAAGKLV